MRADAAKPITRVAGVGFAAVRDPVPVGGDKRLAAILGFLGGVMALVPEIHRLKHSRRKREPARPGKFGE